MLPGSAVLFTVKVKRNSTNTSSPRMCVQLHPEYEFKLPVLSRLTLCHLSTHKLTLSHCVTLSVLRSQDPKRSELSGCHPRGVACSGQPGPRGSSNGGCQAPKPGWMPDPSAAGEQGGAGERLPAATGAAREQAGPAAGRDAPRRSRGTALQPPQPCAYTLDPATPGQRLPRCNPHLLPRRKRGGKRLPYHATARSSSKKKNPR